MKSDNLPKIFTAIAAVLTLASPALRADSLEVDSVILQTVGSTASIPGGGTSANTNFWNLGTVGEFVMVDSSNNPYGLRVTADSRSGTLNEGTDSLMVVQTVNSQGLTDAGTLSVYVRSTGTNTASGAAAVGGAWTLGLTFSFYNVVPDGGGGYTFTTPHSFPLLLTSLDIDFNQKYFTADANFDSFITYGATAINPTTAPAGYTGFTAGGDSSFNDPAHAVSSAGTDSSFSIQLSHNTFALYMFEFRDPSSVVPEPGTAALALVGATVLLGSFRRKRSNLAL